jgi:hypothetical protein
MTSFALVPMGFCFWAAEDRAIDISAEQHLAKKRTRGLKKN